MKAALSQALCQVSTPATHPDGTPYRSIGMKDLKKLCQRQGLSGRDGEIAALEAGVVPERYARNIKVYSLEDQAALLRSCVCVVGMGGLGGTVVEILARLGVGTLLLVDGDTFDESNLNRQFLSQEKGLGKPKVQEAARRVGAINSSVVVHVQQAYLNEDNALSILGDSDVTIDCLGGLKDRFVLEGATKKAGCPLVSAAVAGLYGHVTTIFPADPGLQLIYGDAQSLPAVGAESSLGCLPQITTLLAALESSEATKILLKKSPLLRHRLMVIDLDDMGAEVMDLQKG
ncbi:MAG: HesA/MoeB/ThiF family protein [Thermodesulfobacteriota bacterium]|nr:HesA/MoeB/ThiF family protein [Thermodesulfobacteriota bacterium]